MYHVDQIHDRYAHRKPNLPYTACCLWLFMCEWCFVSIDLWKICVYCSCFTISASNIIWHLILPDALKIIKCLTSKNSQDKIYCIYYLVICCIIVVCLYEHHNDFVIIGWCLTALLLYPYTFCVCKRAQPVKITGLCLFLFL